MILEMMRTHIIFFVILLGCSAQKGTGPYSSYNFRYEITATLSQQVMKEAVWALQQEPLTVTASSSSRSAGGKHDFFSEGDYWWPNPVSADSPYIQKDGMTNPGNFVEHRHAMIRLSRIVGA